MTTTTREIRRVAVLGAGTMGHGIAMLSAKAGWETTLFDVNADAMQRGLAKAAEWLEKAAAKGKLPADELAPAKARLKGASDLSAAVGDADLVVEAAPENLDLKKRIFADLGRLAPRHAILGTNTSSLPVTEVAAAAEGPERVVGLHFFNPPPIMQLLEVVTAERTAPDVLETARLVGVRMGKEVVVVRDSPGFATSRLGLALSLEAMRMVEEGVASAAEIDRAMELGYGLPMGPLKLTDHVGLDVRLAIAEHLSRELGERFRPPNVLRRLVRAGKLGRKTGEGFYKY